MRTQIVPHRRGWVPFTSVSDVWGVTNRRYITSWDENRLAVDSVLDSLEPKFILKEEQRLALHSITKKDVLARLGGY